MHNRYRFSLPVAVFAVTASLGAAACGEYRAPSPGAPSPIFSGANSAFRVGVQPTELFHRRGVGALGTGCPSRQDFFVPFGLHLQSDSASSLFLNQVRFQFTDSSGIPSPSMALPQSDLLSRFGNVGIPPLG